MDKRQSVCGLQPGDSGYLDNLYRLYGRKALGTAFLISGDRGMAEDIVQEAFIICFRNIKELKNPDLFNVWFYRILVRVGWRLTKRQRRCVPADDLEVQRKACAQLGFDGEGDISDRISNRLLISEALKKLPQPQRNTVILYYFNEMTTKEIAGVMDCFQGTVKSRLHKARKLLEKELADVYETNTDSFYSSEELNLNEE